MNRFMLILSYDGSSFFGWQKTPTGPTVEETLEDALFTLFSERVKLEAASRTDRGVHAKGQVVSFSLKRPPTVPLQRLTRSLNALLPPQITVNSADIVPENFHPTLDATGKEYHYLLCNAPVQSPMVQLYSWHVPKPLDLASMERASCDFIGERDFSAFTNLRTEDTVRHVHNIRVRPLEEGMCRIEIRANRFLYKMARNLAGTLIQIGCGKLPSNSIPQLLASRDRTQAGVTAPAHGLFLMNVFYESKR